MTLKPRTRQEKMTYKLAVGSFNISEREIVSRETQGEGAISIAREDVFKISALS